MPYKECYTSTKKKCGDAGLRDKIAAPDLGFDQCIIYCNILSDCKFVSHNIRSSMNNACRLYKSCDTSNEGTNIVTTYSKDGKCPGN